MTVLLTQAHTVAAAPRSAALAGGAMVSTKCVSRRAEKLAAGVKVGPV